MILYMTLICICSRYLLCLFGHLSSPRLKYCNVFWPSLPSNLTHEGASVINQHFSIRVLTSNMSGHKRTIGLKFPKHYRCAWPLIHKILTIFIHFHLDIRDAHLTIFITIHVHTLLFAFQPACTFNTRLSLRQWACHMHISYIYNRVYFNSMIKNINHD